MSDERATSMRTTYMIDGKAHQRCDCDFNSSRCPLGHKRPLQTAGFGRCLLPMAGITAFLASGEEDAAPHTNAAKGGDANADLHMQRKGDEPVLSSSQRDSVKGAAHPDNAGPPATAAPEEPHQLTVLRDMLGSDHPILRYVDAAESRLREVEGALKDFTITREEIVRFPERPR